MLFAEAEVAAGASVVACLLAAITGLFAWLTARDKLRYDVLMVQLETKLDAVTRDVASCHAERDKLRGDVAELEKRCDRQQDEIDRQQEEIDTLTRSGESRQREIEELRSIAGSKHD